VFVPGEKLNLGAKTLSITAFSIDTQLNDTTVMLSVENKPFMCHPDA
jgi:hypothetical protein